MKTKTTKLADKTNEELVRLRDWHVARAGSGGSWATAQAAQDELDNRGALVNRLQEEQKEEVARLGRKGWPLGAIAAKLGITPAEVLGFVQELKDEEEYALTDRHTDECIANNERSATEVCICGLDPEHPSAGQAETPRT